MKKITHCFLIIIALLVMMPTIAQDTIDPAGALDETYTLGNITINYPTGMAVDRADAGVTFIIDDRAGEVIHFATSAQLERDGFVMDDINTIARSWFNSLIPVFRDDRTFEDTAMLTVLAGHPAVAFDMMDSDERYTRSGFGYVVDVDGTFFGVLLVTDRSSSALDVRHALMIRMMESITIDDEPIYEPLVRITPEERVTLGQSVSTTDLTLSLPEGWLFDEDEGYFGTSESALAVANGDGVLDAGDVAGGITALTTSLEIDGRQIITIGYFADSFARDYEAMLYRYDGLGTEAYYIPLPEGNRISPSGAVAIIWQIDVGDVYLAIIATDDFDSQESTILSIIESVALVEDEE